MQKFLYKVFMVMLLMMPLTTWSQGFSYSCDFENSTQDASWVMLNGTQTNGWAIGSATHNGVGSRGLYVSNDNGVTYGYNISAETYAYAYTPLTLTAGVYEYSYDWTCRGEGIYDYFRVMLVPSSVTLNPGFYPENLDAETTPDTWFALDGGTQLVSEDNVWDSYQDIVEIETDATYNLVVFWKCDGAGANYGLPAAIDNIVFSELMCPPPSHIEATTIGSDNVTLEWQDNGTDTPNWEIEYGLEGFELGTGTIQNSQSTDITISGLVANTSYDVYIKAICSATDSSLAMQYTFHTACAMMTIPFFESFENNRIDTVPECWLSYAGETKVVNDRKTQSGSKSLSIKGSGVIVSPYIPLSEQEISVSFMLRREGRQSGVIEVGFVANLTDIDNMVPIAVINPDHNAYYDYDVDFANVDGTDEGYIVWRQRATSNYYAYWLDSVRISTVSDCRRPAVVTSHDITHNSATLRWNAVENISEYQVAYGIENDPNSVVTTQVMVGDTTYTLNNLLGSTNYYVWVRSSCGDNVYSEWRSATPFFTLATCAQVLSLQAPSITTNGIALTWEINTEDGESSTGVEVGWREWNESVYHSTSTTESSYFIRGLQPNTKYDVRVRSICSEHSSEYVSMAISTPPCGHVVSRGEKATTLIPMGGYFNYSYTQMLYPASDLMGLDSVKGISFRMKSGDATRTVTIYMANVSQDSLSSSSPIALSAMTKVAENVAFTLESGWCGVQFTTPFRYDGTSNLLVAIDDNSGELSTNNVYYHDGTSLYVRDDEMNINPGNPPAMSYFAGVADVSFLGSCNEGGCAAPLLTVNRIDATSVDLKWAHGGSENSWRVEYRLGTEGDWIVDADHVTDTIHTIDGLQAGNTYQVRVGAYCNNNIYYSYITVMVACDLVSAPFFEDFNSGELDPCWYSGNTNGSGDMPEVADLTGVLNFRDRDGGYVILPEFNDQLSTLTLRFKMLSMFLESKLVVKIGTNPMEINSFVAIDTISVRSTESYEPKLCNLEHYEGEGQFIMLYAIGRQVYIDDVSVQVTPECSVPINLAISNVSYDGADITWEGDNAHTSEWIVLWNKVGDSEQHIGHLDALSDLNYSIIGLLSNTLYQAKVANICQNGDTIYSVESVTFRTSCGNVELPYLENFENERAEVFPTCWNRIDSADYYDENYNHWTVPTIVNTNGEHGMALSLSMDKAALTPHITVPADTLLLNFDMRSEDFSHTGKLIIGFSTSETNLTGMIAIDTITPTSNAWTNYEIPFEAINTQEEGYIVFKNIENEGVLDSWGEMYFYSALHIDNVAISYNNGCGRVSNVELISVSDNAATLSFTDANQVGNYTIGWATTNNVMAIGENVMTSTSTTATVTNLQPATRYYMWVRVDCSAEASGSWVALPSFVTPCAPSTLPYTENFDSYTTDISTFDMAPFSYPEHTLPSCWLFQNMSNSINNLPQAYLYLPSAGTYAEAGNCLYLRANEDSPIFAILPHFAEDISTLQLSFTYRNQTESADGGTFVLGVMTNINDTNSFIPLEQLPLTTTRTTVEHNFILDEALVAGGNYTIAFRYQGGYYSDKAVGIDAVAVQLAPSCITPANLKLKEVSATTATIAWRGSANNYNVSYREAGTSAWSTATTVTADSIILTGLLASTTYQVHVQAICSANETSAWSDSLVFTTQCGAMAIPYSEDFNSYTEDVVNSSWTPDTYPNHAMPSCWSFPVLGDAHPQIFLSNKSGYGVSGSNCLFFVSGNGEDAFAILPTMAQPINTLQISFTYRNESEDAYNGILSVGVMTNIADTSTFMPLETYPISIMQTNVSHNFAIDESLVDGTDYTIAFRYRGVRNYQYLSIDNVVVDNAPLCAVPSTPELVNVEHSSAQISWNGSSSQYQVSYRKVNGLSWTDSVVASTSFTLTELNSVTSYEVRVRALCSATDTSDWSGLLQFTTSCASYNLPFSEDFSTVVNVSTDLQCWNIYKGWLNDDGTANLQPNTYIWDWSSAKQLNNGGKNMYIEIESNDVNGWLVTPEINIISATTLTFNLGRREPYSGNTIWDADDRFVVLASADNGATWTSLQTWTGTDYQNIPVYTSPAQSVTISLDQFANQSVRIAFYGESTVASGSDHYIHIDDIHINSPHLCFEPSNLAVNDVTDRSATLSWEGSATTYNIGYRQRGSVAWITAIENLDETHFTLTGLHANTTYEWRVRSNCSAGNNISEWVSLAFTTTDMVCDMPTELQANAGYTDVTLSWMSEASAWEAKIIEGSQERIETLHTNPATISGLTMGTNYRVMMRALCDETHNSEWCESIAFTTEICQPVAQVTASDITNHSATITWISEGSETSWEVKYGPKGFNSEDGDSEIVNEKSLAIDALTPGTEYDVYVRAICTPNAMSAWSSPVCRFSTTGGQQGIDGVAGNFQFNIYPNPTSGATTITLQGVAGKVAISVVDMNGRIVTSESIECGVNCEKRIDVAGLAQGTYFVRILGDNLNSVRKLIVR